MFRRLFQFSVPSALGVCLAGLIASLAETAPHSHSLSEAVAGAGFLLLFALPLGIAASLSTRGLVQAWKLETLLGPLKDERGASPRVAAWALFLLGAVLLLAIGSFQGMRLLFAMTRINTLVALGAPVVVVIVAMLLAAVSRPMVDLLTLLLAGLEGRFATRGWGPVLTPLKVVSGVALLIVASALLSWFVFVMPNIGHLDISFVFYLLIFVVGTVALPPLYARLPRGSGIRATTAALLTFSVLACIGTSQWTRYNRPYRMLEIWGETKLAGWAIDTIYDVQGLRVDMQLEGIKPELIVGAKHPNVVVVTIDTVRADQLPIHGGKAKMPALEAFAKTGAVFERAFSPGNVTRRSIPTLATGLSPNRVRGRVVGWALRLDPRHILLGERFFAGGYETAGFFCCRSHFGRDHKLGLINGLKHVEIEYEGLALAEKTVAWLAQRKASDKPLFLWTHYIEPHNWTKDHKPADGARNKKDRYNLSLTATDESLQVLFDGIREHLGEDTIIVVTSDHGEGLGDHGIPNHSGSLYNSEIHVPLVIGGPGIKPSRMSQAVGLVDLAPTLLELAGFKPPGMPQMDGLSVAPELIGERKDTLGMGEAYAAMVADRSVRENQTALMSGRYKLIEREGSRFELYDLSRDPNETRDIKDESVELFESMRARLKRRHLIDRVSPF